MQVWKGAEIIVASAKLCSRSDTACKKREPSLSMMAQLLPGAKAAVVDPCSSTCLVSRDCSNMPDGTEAGF
jgi:hypothetical protein